MKTSRILAVAALAFCTLPVFAQQKRVSPHETINRRIDGKVIMVVYGRPYTKDPKTGEPRKIWGTLVPYGKVWRMGSDEATLLVNEADLQIGDVTIPAGAHTLYMLPDENGAKLVINKQVGQWGTQYDEKQDLARIDMKKESLDKPVDQFTMAIDKNPDGGGILKASWENTQFSVPFTVKK